jgi:serine/threonine protein kinase
MEFASGGSLKSELLNRAEPYSEEEAKHYFVQIVRGLKYLLEEHYVSHLDIKLQNILIFQSLETEEKLIKLSDFGLSRISYSQQFGLSMRKIDYGTIAYMSPQVLAFYPMKILKRKDKLIIESTKQKVILCQADIWSLSICLYLMLCKAFPFDPDFKGMKNRDDKCYHMLEQQSKEKYSFPKLIKRQLSKQLKHLIASMLTFDPNQRITIKCITAHEWVLTIFHIFLLEISLNKI